MRKLAKALIPIAITCFFAQPSVAEDAIAQCLWLAKVYNRCGTNMRFAPDENKFEFPKSSRSAPCTDHKNLPIRERIAKADDVASMLIQKYTEGPMPLPEERLDYSPGAVRNMDFMESVYGSSPGEVKQNLVSLNFLGHQVLFTRLNGAAYQLSLVDAELRSLYSLGTDKQLTEFLRPFFSGSCPREARCDLKNYTYQWRLVRATTKLSNHSFGTAIDLEPATGPEYWLWDVQDQVRDGKAVFAPGSNASHYNPDDVINFVPKKNPTYPQKLVEVFEKHGFIWGGKWYRYDIMHFEFRPEFFPQRTLACGPTS